MVREVNYRSMIVSHLDVASTRHPYVFSLVASKLSLWAVLVLALAAGSRALLFLKTKTPKTAAKTDQPRPQAQPQPLPQPLPQPFFQSQPEPEPLPLPLPQPKPEPQPQPESELQRQISGNNGKAEIPNVDKGLSIDLTSVGVAPVGAGLAPLDAQAGPPSTATS